MNRLIGVMLLSATVCAISSSARADDAKVTEILDKAFAALGGKDKLAKAEGTTWKSRAKITIEGNENELSLQGTVQGIDHYRSEFEGDFGGNTVKGLVILKGDKGWRKFGDMVMELEGDALANEKRMVYLVAAHTTLKPLTMKEFKIEAAGEESVGGKPAVGLKVTPPDGKDFTIYFDKESGLPVRQVAKVQGWQGDEYTQDSTFSDYKDFGGIKKATKVASKRDGADFVSQEFLEFKFMDKVPEGTFDEPK
jgi:zinc protease